MKPVIPNNLAEISFTVPGPLLGYRASVKRAFDPKYKSFKRGVWALAMKGGFKDVPIPTLEAPVWIGFRIKWAKRPRIDWSNVCKALEDSLFPQDRYCRPFFVEWMPNCGVESAHVMLKWRGKWDVSTPADPSSQEVGTIGS